MSDLSVPPLSLVPFDQEGIKAAPPPVRGAGFAWPTPDLPIYPGPIRFDKPAACEVEGLNGHSMVGRLLHFDLEHGIVHVQIPPARSTMPLRFNQFRRLRLMQPLAPLQIDPERTTPLDLIDRPVLNWRIHWLSGPPTEGTTITHQELPQGLFLFEPADADGSVKQCFIPRDAYDRADVGTPIGEELVAQKAATAAQVDDALHEQQRLRAQKLGEMLVVRRVITADELVNAIEEQAKMPMVRIGQALTALGLIDEQQLEQALALQRQERGVPLGELLVRKGHISRQDLQSALARKMGYPMVDVSSFQVDPEALARLPYPVACRVPALPLMIRAGRLVVAVEDPTKRSTIDELEFAAQGKVLPVLARAAELHAAVDKAYKQMGIEVFLPHGEIDSRTAIEFDPAEASKLLATLEQEHSAEQRSGGTDEDISIEQSDNSLVRLINTMIVEAQSQGVSDIHIECQPGRDKVKVRFRKDGQLRPYLELPHTYRSALIARIKIMCDLDIAERRKPQDGKINFGKFMQGQKLELRVATIPTQNNLEDAVMRLLASAKPIPLDNLNLSPHNLRRVKEMVQRPYGMFLCVGPTGSGKTTTLHSALGYINRPDRKIWTAEDPVEITQPGLRQVQVNPKIDLTFARALRAFLRADPDVIMVGEIRDKETAQMAIEASLTGHLVLSTLHTNSAPETVTRLLDMGMDPFNFADALLGVLAQRLVRRICTHCRTAREAAPEEVEELLRDYMHSMRDAEPRPTEDELLAEWRERFAQEGKLQTYESRGCKHCDNTGFKGRAGLHELMGMSHGMRHLIQTGTRADELQRSALSEGMRTLRQDGIEKVLAGVTTIAEVRATTNG
jgi:type II secretory ATPase GspE/PulE/Tfp pilus assembly ATPase PilB-like protein